MLKKVLVANRGEIACRIQRSLERLGIESVAVYSDEDAGAPHVRNADEAFRLGPAPVEQSYLLGDRIAEIAKEAGCDAVHPGYGLLSEDPDFAAHVEASGLQFLGPTPQQLLTFGRKHSAREIAETAGLPLLPGTQLIEDLETATRAAETLGYPVLLKTTAGGGGIGMAHCHDAEELSGAWESVRRLGAAHFGASAVFLERFVARARHVEVQIFGDGRGRVQTLGTRDCSLQRRRQKVVEEAPAAFLAPELTSALEEAARRLGEAVDYRSAGTVEFLVDVDTGSFFFLEVNTRLQVEHPVTEMIFGIDLVEWMIRLGANDASFLSEPITASGHAIEARIYAEDPARDDRPGTGTVAELEWPAGVRVDTWIELGTRISPFYDPLLAKLIVRGDSRAEAVDALEAALSKTRLLGVTTNLMQLLAVTGWTPFREGIHHTTSLAELDWSSQDVEVVAATGQVTVHDLPGRIGAWGVGVPPSGPMDPLAHALANRWLGNDGRLPTLEIAISGPRLIFPSETWAAYTGAEAEVTIDGVAIETNAPFLVPAGGELAVGTLRGPGARGSLAVRGGFVLPEVLGSASTFTLGGFGGQDGRALRAGDLLAMGDARDPARCPDDVLKDASTKAPRPELPTSWEIGVLDGPHTSPEFLRPEGVDAFYATTFEVHYQSSRSGVRLIGPKPIWAREDGGEAGLHPSNLHDTAYSVGAIDYTGDMPVILGPDGPSLGGFVCPAVIASAERWKMGQLRPGDRVQFRALEPEQAERLRLRQTEWLDSRGARGSLELEGALSKGPSGVTQGILARRDAAPQRPEMTIRQSGDTALLIEYGPMVLDLDLRIRIQLLLRAIESSEESVTSALIDLTPGIRSLQVHFDPSRIDRALLIRSLEEIDQHLPVGDELRLPTRIVRLPLSFDDPATREAIKKYEEVVRDDAPWCPSNLEFIRRINGLDSIEDVRRIVFDATYLVLGLGDVYLGAPVATPIDPRHRLVTTKYNPARTWTPENAVGIGGAYLCIYGMEGPGGYQFVGRTVPVWSTFGRAQGTSAGQPWLLRNFDQIRFYPVEPDELLELREGVRQGRVGLEIEEAEFDVGQHRAFLRDIEPETQAFRDKQQAAFAVERRLWEERGEFEAADRAAESAPEAQLDADALNLEEGESFVESPLNAMVYRVTAQEGSRTEAGEELIVLSAMKTETAIVAPCAGRVQRILCEANQVVTAGAPLLVFQPAADSEQEVGGPA